MSSIRVPTTTHWGRYELEIEGGKIAQVHGALDDPWPSPIGRSLCDTLTGGPRIKTPSVRKGFLENGANSDRSKRGQEPFVSLPWDHALDLVETELRRVKAQHGNQAIYAGSYGWASAGRFHHAQSQLHRFMNLFGGYTASVNTYSTGALEVILPYILCDKDELFAQCPTWEEIASNSQLIVAFGGIPAKNFQVNAGGVYRHSTIDWLRICKTRGVSFVNVSPNRGDMPSSLDADWVPVRPNSDVALMLGLAHTLIIEGLYDRQFVERHCIGFDRFHAYAIGTEDGVVKDAAWAANIAQVPADDLRNLARRMAASRTLVTLAWSLQRADHGEQPIWMSVVLASMLGGLGRPGSGVAFGYGAIAGIGENFPPFNWASLAQGTNSVSKRIPVARIADMLLSPGEPFEYGGQRWTYPDIRAIYWEGGNPFHHHQDLARLIRAWARPEVIIIQEPFWTSSARYADIVLPTTTAVERNDFACARYGMFIAPMPKAVPPQGEARNDYDVLLALAKRLGFGDAFGENRSEMDWLLHLYEVTRQRAAEFGYELPSFDEFWSGHGVALSPKPSRPSRLARFRNDPGTFPLSTSSGRVEIYSETIAGYAYDDCPGHPTWIEPTEWLGSHKALRFPLHLLTNQPAARLHSQLDHGITSRESKVRGHEPVRMNPMDAGARGIVEGDIVRVHNDRGSCLAGAVLTDDLRPGVVLISTGAWLDYLDPSNPAGLECHGNPNVLTLDKGTSRLAQGSSANTALVEIERWEKPMRDVAAHIPPLGCR